jgi:hypothetical protein
VKSSDESEETVSATVFVPEKASDFFALKIEAYRDKETEKGNPKNEPLIACLDDISLGTVRALFTDNLSSFPSSESQEVWWEVWLRHGYRESFQRIAEILNIRTTEHFTFPEREVVLTLTSITTLSRIIINNGLIAELRLAKDSPSIFFEMETNSCGLNVFTMASIACCTCLASISLRTGTFTVTLLFCIGFCCFLC